MQNNRYHTRHTVSVPATLESGGIRIGAVVLDISATGARVRLTAGAFLGNECVLTTSLLGESVRSRIVWRRGTEVGLRFRATLAIKPNAAATQSKSFGASRIGGFGRRA